MTSDLAGVPRAAAPPTTERAFVWTWLPGAQDPVVAGRLDRQDGGVVRFTYGRSYLGRDDAIPLYVPELPLRRGPIAPVVGEIANCIADAGPDGWGRRVILNRRVGADAVDTEEAAELSAFLLEEVLDGLDGEFRAELLKSSLPAELTPRIATAIGLDERFLALALRRNLFLRPVCGGAENGQRRLAYHPRTRRTVSKPSIPGEQQVEHDSPADGRPAIHTISDGCGATRSVAQAGGQIAVKLGSVVVGQ